MGEISWVSIVHVPYLPKPTGNKATNNVHVHCSFVKIIFVDPLRRESGWPEGIIVWVLTSRICFDVVVLHVSQTHQRQRFSFLGSAAG